ncbi:hypothetical protein [Sphingomonas sp. dw_22]|uniref:hypothetical protein n=1 Tax=Sphingomonas sp. dw_22 TaxID=2721175 RepID=UPI001BD2023F|nr:hypothetical protein [Sphingomonas sp. dw_22]
MFDLPFRVAIIRDDGMIPIDGSDTLLDDIPIRTPMRCTGDRRQRAFAPEGGCRLGGMAGLKHRSRSAIL